MEVWSLFINAIVQSIAFFSAEVGVGEARDSFWTYFAKGKAFAKRQTMWDALFTGFRSMGRNESIIEYAMKMVMQALMNFSIGLIMCLVIFIFGLYSIIKSYDVSLFEGLAFFIIASAAAFATVTTVLGGMFGGVAATGFALAKVAEANNTIQNDMGGSRASQQRRHLHQQ